MSDVEMWAVDEAMCRVIARADRWLTVSLAIDALRAAELQWRSMEKEARREVPDAPVAGQSTLTVTMEPEGLTMPKPIGIAAPLERMPEIPAAQRRS